MASTISEKLKFLYGPGHFEVQKQIEQLIAEKKRAIGPAHSDRRLSERDALLITYGDQVRAEGETPLACLERFLQAHLSETVSGVHILPFYPYSSDDGFSVIDFHAVDPALGSWAEVERIGRSFDLMFDAVFNHMSAGSCWFRDFLAGKPEFANFFVTVDGDPDLRQVVRPRALPLLTEFPTPKGPVKVWTTFSADQVDLNFHNPDVLVAILEVLLFYVEKGARMIRLDAIAYLWKEIGTPCIHLPQTHAMIQLCRAALDQVAPGVQLITETNVPHRDNISYFGDGSNEAQLVYNFALPPLVLHTLHTGNATALARWAATLELPSDRVTFFNFLASHDGIGVNPVRGILEQSEIDALVQRTFDHGGFVSYKHNPDGTKSPYEMNISYFDALSAPGSAEPLPRQVERFMVAQSIMLCLRGVPGIYFHSLFGSRGDRAGAEESGIPRRINRQKLEHSNLESELAEPGSIRNQVFSKYQRLLQARRRHAAFHPFGEQQVLEGDPRLFAVLRSNGAERVLCLHNVTGREIVAPLELFELGSGIQSLEVIAGLPATPSVVHGPLALSSYQVLWLRLVQ